MAESGGPTGGLGLDGERGRTAEAIRKAEAELTEQYSATAALDLQVVTAILNAHATARDGAGTLRQLQQEVQDAVRLRTDLDTVAGSRDFQRYLIGKLRQIGAVVETVSLDDGSKAALAAAWAGLYAASRSGDAPTEEPGGVPEAVLPQDVPDPAGPGPDPSVPADYAVAPANSAATPTTSTAGLPAFPGLPLSGFDGGGGVPGGFSLPRLAGGSESAPLAPDVSDLLLPEDSDDLTEPDRPAEAEPVEPEPGEDEADTPEEPPEQADGPTDVRLPDGEIVQAASPELAAAVRAVLAGTPVDEAYSRQDLDIPPAGTTPAHPLGSGQVGVGDVALFTDHVVVALADDKAWVDGQVQPLSAVGGPEFLGWAHPAAEPERPVAPPVPEQPADPPPDTAPPAPTRPADATVQPEEMAHE